MRTLSIIFLTLWSWGAAQTPLSFDLRLEEIQISQAPKLQSFAAGTHEGRWLLIGGRTEGLHKRRPFESFEAAYNNQNLYVVEIDSGKVWSAAISSLPLSLQEQLQSSNMEFEQRDSILYLVGGYGYSAAAGDHITHGYLTAIHLPGAIDAVINQGNLNPHFRQIQDSRLAVTGGYLDRKGDTFYLVCGQYFEGRYNPHGPTHGPGFIQEYTEEIRSFKILDTGISLSIGSYTAMKDSAQLHRRDYNLVPQIFPNGESGFTIFSGVFQHNADLPWLNTVDVQDSSYTVVPGFQQYLSQYHSANLPVYDSANNEMHTFFFGGMSRYTMDTQGNLIEDVNVPFVKTISRVSRYANGSMNEFKLSQEMPYLTGSGGEFIPARGIPRYENDIIRLNDLPNGQNLLGYIIGGIESSAANIFFSNTGNESEASNRIFKVFLDKTAVARELPVGKDRFFTASLGPNPSRGKTRLIFEIPQPAHVMVKLWSMQGKLLEILSDDNETAGAVQLDLDLGKNYPPGTYLISLDNGWEQKTLKLILR